MLDMSTVPWWLQNRPAMPVMSNNPTYSMTPVMPPGWQGIPYMLGPIVADLTGGVARPYVPPNMSTADATLVSQVYDPLYKTMLSGMYGQMGEQIGATLGGISVIQKLGQQAGYTPAETQKALQDGVGAFARSRIGSFVMPLVDSGLNAIGLTGGSFVGAAQAAFSSRMNLLGAGTLVNPYDAGQQHQAMAAAAATATMLNSIVSQRDDKGRLLLTANQQVMQGFSRERVAQLAMRAAGMGMFTSGAGRGFDGMIDTGTGSLADRLAQVVDNADFDLSQLTLANFDGKTGGALDSSKAARRVEAIKTEVTKRIQGITEAMGAMRDLTGEVDERLEQLLDEFTDGNWLRSGNAAFATRDALRTLQATSQVYNISPSKALEQIRYNRFELQEAAGFNASLRNMGFSGGGMFGLAAQTELLASIEDAISARGVRGDPLLSDRLRKQGIQGMARNMNAVAGRAAQVLAYARQTGAVSQEEADDLANELTSGDSGRMGSGLNRLLTTVFGSAEVGRRFMNDTMQMNAMRMAMDDNAGKFATSVTMIGADAEFRRREQVSAASQRLAFTQQALAESGMNTWQTAEGTDKVVANIVATIRGDGEDPDRVADAEAFKQQFDAMVAKGVDPRTAASAVVSAYKRSPVTAQYAQEIDLAIKQQSAINNEEALLAGGLESRQATSLVRELTMRGGIDGTESSEIYALVRDGKGAEALARVNGIVEKLDPATRQQMERVRADAVKRHEDALETMRGNQEAEALIGLVTGRGYSGEDVARAYETMAAAGLRYASSAKTAEDYDIFWESVSKSKFVDMFGAKALEGYMNAARGEAVDAEGNKIDAVEYFNTMGRRAGAVRRIAVANLGESGHGLEMLGYWGGGATSVNSPEARKQRDDTINSIADALNKDAFLQAGDRDSLATNVVDFLMGNKDWRSLLKVYDPEGSTGLESSLAKYGASFQKYEEAQAAYNAAQKDYVSALGVLADNKDFTTLDWVKKVFSGGARIEIDDLRESLSAVDDEDVVKKIMTAAEARNAVLDAQSTNKQTLRGAVADKETAKELKGLTSWWGVQKQRNEKLANDSKIAAFIADFDFSEEGIKKATGLDKAWLDKMFAAVTDDEVAAAVGVEATEGVKQRYGETAFRLVQQKAQKGSSPEAAEAMKAVRAAQRDAATRIHGVITLKSGNDSVPAVLDGNIGGLA